MSTEAMLHAAIALHREGRVRDAAQQYAALLDANPRHPAANHNLGVQLAHAGKPRHALRYLEHALALAPRGIGCGRGLTDCHHLPGRLAGGHHADRPRRGHRAGRHLPRSAARRDARHRGRTQGGRRRAQQDRDHADRGGAAHAGPACGPAGARRDRPHRPGLPRGATRIVAPWRTADAFQGRPPPASRTGAARDPLAPRRAQPRGAHSAGSTR